MRKFLSLNTTFGLCVYSGWANNMRELVEHVAKKQNGYLRHVDLREQDLTEADLAGVDCEDSLFTGANLTDVNFKQANLRYCDLSYTNLKDTRLYATDLSGAKGIIDAGQDARGFRFLGVKQYRVGFRVVAGCRMFTIGNARKHWVDRYQPELETEIFAKLDLIERVALVNNWLPDKGGDIA